MGEYFEELGIPVKKIVSVRVLPGIGTYGKYQFIGSPQNTALALELDVLDTLNKLSLDAVILDITHSISFLPVTTYSGVFRAAKIYATLNDKAIPISVINSGPVQKHGQTLCIHIVRIVQAAEKPLAMLRKTCMDIKTSEHVKPYKLIIEGRPSKDLEELDRHVGSLYRSYYTEAIRLLEPIEHASYYMHSHTMIRKK